MAESCFVFFKAASWADVGSRIDCLAARVTPGARQWVYPPAACEHTLQLYEYDTLEGELEDDQRRRLRASLGGAPSATLCLELRRSQQDRAADDAVALTTALLQHFDGVADDAAENRLWTLEQILVAESTGADRYLDVYGRRSGVVRG